MTPLFLFAQEKTDTIAVSDSLKLYDNIQKFAVKRKVTRWLYRAVFIDRQPPEAPLTVKEKKKKKRDPFLPYKGKIIRNIEYVSLDPFSTSVENMELEQKNFLAKAGNRLHIRTTRYTIRNQLLFKTGDRIDPLAMKETERIIRQRPFVRDAKVTVLPILHEKDSVDVMVVVQDVWSITASAAVSAKSSTVRLVDKNFVGSGQLLENTFNYRYKDSAPLDVTGSYTIPAIRKTFITGSVFYRFSPTSDYQGISFSRQFYTTVTKWAGGVSTFFSSAAGSFQSPEGLITTFPIRYDNEDVWLGRSFQVLPGKADIVRSARLVITSRINRMDYTKRPYREIDTLGIYQSYNLYLTSIGFSTRQYYKDRNIFRFGFNEDVPEGRLVELTTGAEQRIFYTRPYAGIRVAAGERLNKFGYVAASVEYGTFYRNRKIEKAALNADLNYFTDLLKMGRWSMRQFIYCKYTHGARRDPAERITINNELYGFSGVSLTGTTKIFLNLQNVLYTPLHFIGFQFAFVGFGGFGMVSEPLQPIFRAKVYQAYGLGILLRNEHLIVNTFQLSFGFYPNLEGAGSYKFNPITSYNLRFKDYFLSRPDVVAFQ